MKSSTEQDIYLQCGLMPNCGENVEGHVIENFLEV